MKLPTPLLALLALSAAGAWAQDYEIRLARPMKVGEEFETDETSRHREGSVMTRMGTPVSNQGRDYTLTYGAVEKILEVDAAGQARRMSSTIGHFEKQEDGINSNVLAKGTVVIATVNGMKQTYEVNGQFLNSDVTLLLDSVISMAKLSDTIDMIFGTSERKRVGDRWDINADLTTRDFTKVFGMPVNNVQGTVLLADPIKKDDGEMLVVKVHVTGTARLPMMAGVVLDQSNFVYDIENHVMADPAREDRGGELTFTNTFSTHADVPGAGRLISKGQLVNYIKRDARRLPERRPLGVPLDSTL